MKENFGWIAKHLVLPLIPFIFGTLIRFVLHGPFICAIFDPAELSFSMAMLCFLVTLNASKLRDNSLAEGISFFNILGMIIFISLFVLTVFTKVLVDNNMLEILGAVKKALTDGRTNRAILKIFNNNETTAKYVEVLATIKLLTVISSIAFFSSAIFFKFKYKLED